MNGLQQHERPPVSFYLKRGTLIGAALGMLAGLVYLAIIGVAPENQVASIVLWRNFILIGAATGLPLGAVTAWWSRSPESSAIESSPTAQQQKPSP